MTETPTEKTKDPNEPEQPKDRIALAKEAADSLKAENERMEANIAKLEGLRAEQVLSGTTNAGQPPEEKKEMSNSDYMKSVMAGKIPNDKE